MTVDDVAVIGSRGFPSSYGGFETLVRHLAPYLRDRGFEVTVYCRGRGLRSKVQRVEGVRCVHTFGIDRKVTSTLSFGLTAAAASLRRRHGAVLVLNVANGFYLPVLARAGIPAVVNVDGVEWERDKWGAFGKKVFRVGAQLTARHAAAIVVDSHAIGDLWRSTFQADSIYIPYGADVVTGSGWDRLTSLGIEPGTYVLVVARLVPENNVDLLLAALGHLRSEPPVVVVGSAVTPDRLEAELRRRAATLPGFHWLGHVSDQELLTQLWANCAVYFHGHSVGGTNPALLQALGCGSPTIALDTPFNREVVGDAGILCPRRPEVLAGQIDDLLHHPGLGAELAERGRRRVGERYRWDDVCDRYATLLRSLARSGAAVAAEAEAGSLAPSGPDRGRRAAARAGLEG